jgi:hypothetical protein
VIHGAGDGGSPQVNGAAVVELALEGTDGSALGTHDDYGAIRHLNFSGDLWLWPRTGAGARQLNETPILTRNSTSLALTPG